MPKPFVHLVPRPFPVALDARMAGDQTRFARSGCRPNAILRPVLCKDKRKGDDGRAGEGDDGSDGRKDEGELEDDPGTLRFAMFALRDLKACEEIVLGWEWDDGSVVHQLPALIEAGARAGPSKMTCVFTFLCPSYFLAHSIHPSPPLHLVYHHVFQVDLFSFVVLPFF